MQYLVAHSKLVTNMRVSLQLTVDNKGITNLEPEIEVETLLPTASW